MQTLCCTRYIYKNLKNQWLLHMYVMLEKLSNGWGAILKTKLEALEAVHQNALDSNLKKENVL